MIRFFILLSFFACSSGVTYKDKSTYEQSVYKTLENSKKDIISCEEIYAENADFNNAPEAKVDLTLLIKNNGSLASADLAAHDITHHDVKECMLRKIKSLKFARHDFGDEIEINSHLTLKKLTHTHKGRGRTTFP